MRWVKRRKFIALFKWNWNESVNLRKCPYDHLLTDKALSQWQTFLGVFSYKMAAKLSGIDMEQNYVTVALSNEVCVALSGTPGTARNTQGPDLQNILRLPYDYLAIMTKSRSTYDIRKILRRTQGFVRHDSLARSLDRLRQCSQISLRYSWEIFQHV